MEDLLEKHLYVLILCGGGGKRLWPRSRIKFPKQFIKLLGEKTIFQDTVKRARTLVPYARIFVVTNFDYVDEVRIQAPGIPRKNIISEPRAKDTAMAIGIGTLFIHKVDPLAVITILASDHHVENLQKFDQAVKIAAQAANLGDFLVTIGIKPTFPHTGMGYIKTSHLFKKIDNASIFKVEKFVEKPNLQTAEKFLSEGGYFWNSNLYTWRADSILRAIDKHLPKTAAGIEKIRESLETSKEKEVIERVYQEVESISIDYGVSEKSKNILLVPADFPWSDIGDWKVAYDISKKDKEGNVVIFEKGKGEYVGMETKNCLIHFSDELIATIGVENLIIVDTKDALLVARKDKAQDVKKLVNFLKEKGKDKYL
ncbi:mannose-1-phosphate guanylyltransferase [Candidatus Shapirobacteria bacterium CG10_big_fil_rev_8_21_14_0_10_40_9]|uniref:mannose-1-phosphate guanylyltransferase n=1 Tax=Candidatus Shapirobacteria bacterium CG10_big_fil_rev_8_21_14_0_10_40_9 TaxID=1974888 RepID=A0A2M8L3A5_9BACT|nr:MAG: mannose-1-phosphate guanylyltransferase [Candidatus Shapirobacteria bacterium CG10_big_fil_rev_8_21_14_0_10_40_9]